MPDAVQSVGQLSRRSFLGGAAALLPAATLWPAAGFAADPGPAGESPYPGFLKLQTNPDNLEFPFALTDSFLTPNERFYVRSHFNVPELDAADWSLSVEGHVERPFEIGYDELRKLEPTMLTALLECAGNGRVYLPGAQAGLRWHQGGVGNAEWTGVPLSKLLERAGVKAGAVDVILEGHDQGKVSSNGPASEIPFARSIPLDKARQPEVLLAWQMNGEELSPAHGYPVRAVVGGWYGMASIKWLKRIVVTDRPFDGYFQTMSYTIWQPNPAGLMTLVPVAGIPVKSQLARPTLDEVIKAGAEYRIRGAAWCGDAELQSVEISTDGGESWQTAELTGESSRYAWRLFEYRWQVPKAAGRHTVMSRATDSQGRVQPMERNADLRDAMIHHIQPVTVQVRNL